MYFFWEGGFKLRYICIIPLLPPPPAPLSQKAPNNLDVGKGARDIKQKMMRASTS